MKPSVLIGKGIRKLSGYTGRGTGSTWPGHIALKIDPHFLHDVLKKNPQLKLVLVAGTNGKTTTTKLIQEVLEQTGGKVFRNAAGANLLNGVISTLIQHANIHGVLPYTTAILEIDENSLPVVISELTQVENPISIILLNLFRDQLDRYGEVNTIARNWLSSLKTLPKKTVLIVNGDDPMLRFIGENSELHSYYFGLSEKYMRVKDAPHDVDFLFCPHCGTELVYSKRSYSHMGIYTCPKCHFKHRETATFETLPNPMFGIYNRYNINAATLLLQKAYGIDPENVAVTLERFAPAFGRQEKISYKNREIFLLLSKNPTGFNQSIEAILEQDKNPHVLLLLNDRIPDGRDVSWIWDVDTEDLVRKTKRITVSGDRCFDMALRIKYSSIKPFSFDVEENLEQAITTALRHTPQNTTLYILATYSAMLDTRKILKGHAIL